MSEDYPVIVVCYERNGAYSHTTNTNRSNALNVIEDWCIGNFGLCEIINMRKINTVIKAKIKKDDD